MAEKAFERALEALALRERTTAELAAWLAKRGFERAEVEDAVDRLVASGAVDDERFATEFAADKRELRGWGPDRIREALYERGLDPALIEAAVSTESHSEQLRRAVELLERRSDPVFDERSRARALAYLARRGIRLRARLRRRPRDRTPRRVTRLPDRPPSVGAGLPPAAALARSPIPVYDRRCGRCRLNSTLTRR